MSLNQPTPPSSTSSTNGASPNDQQFRVVRKRNRIPLSCAPCRHRKLKCNRGHPCDNCTKRGDTVSCNYATPKNRKASTAHPANQSADDMQNRIDKLEGLVLSLMGANGSSSAGSSTAQAAVNVSRSASVSTASELRNEHGHDTIYEEPEDVEDDSEVERVSKGLGVMKMDGQKTIFASESHWYTILSEINEVKQYFASHKEEVTKRYEAVKAATQARAVSGPFLLQGMVMRTREEILEAFPPKADSDRLIARYFNAYDPSLHIIHGPSFQKQYDAHWTNPGSATPVWLGLCFAMMTLALQSYTRAGDEPLEYQGRSEDLSHEYRKLTAQCLLLADILQPLPAILETLMLYLQAEYGRSRDSDPGVLLLSSLCVRVATRMGYHRDPGPHRMLTPFQGEMRRRVWSYVRMIDLLISHQFGMSAIVRSDHTDTLLPRNLYDDEMHEDMTALPPSRPSFQVTPMTYMIAKAKMTFLFGRIMERLASVTNEPSYEEIMAFDRELREIRSLHPSQLQMRPFAESARDPANLIMQRTGLELVYLRSLFVLHRKYIARGRDVPRYAYSRTTCVDASMEMLAHQATLHEESQPGGRLRSVKWYISSLTTHDFLLAGGLVCLDLYHQSQTEVKNKRKGQLTPQSPMSMDLYADERKQAMLAAVERCIGIWNSVKDLSMEAWKASTMLQILLDKIRAGFAQASAAAAQLSPANSASQRSANNAQRYNGQPLFAGTFPNGQVASFKTEDLAPEQSAAMTLGMLSSGGLSPAAGFNMTDIAQEKQNFPTGMSGLMNYPVQSERTGLTPGYSGPDGGPGIQGPASPFSNMFSSYGGAMGGGLDTLGGDVDWSAWDSFIQGNNGTAMDTTSMMWPNTDLPNFDLQGQMSGQGGQGGVFMGAGTPGQTNMM